MAYWRMQLHPNDAANSARHTATSIARGLIGLDFLDDVGDLRQGTERVGDKQRNYVRFFDRMAVGDWALVQSHNFPFALVRVSSDYLYVPNASDLFGDWFRHLRTIDRAYFYADRIKGAQDWRKLTMLGTLDPLTNPESETYRLIEAWLRDVGDPHS